MSESANQPTEVQDVEELERDAADALLNPEYRHMCQIKAFLIRNGYRLLQLPKDDGIVQVIHIPSGAVIERLSTLELQYARMGPQGWLEHVQQRYKDLKEQKRRSHDDYLMRPKKSTLIYHKLHNSDIQKSYFVRNGEDISNSVDPDTIATEIHRRLKEMAFNYSTGKITVTFQEETAE